MGNMKANKKFVEGEEAVSAVIGVILMVAITVAIAATVYVYVSGMLTPGSTKAPDITFVKDEVANKLQVTQISSPTVLWTDLEITASTGTVTGDTAYSGYILTGQTINVTAFDAGGFCNFTVSYGTTTLYGSYQFVQ